MEKKTKKFKIIYKRVEPNGDYCEFPVEKEYTTRIQAEFAKIQLSKNGLPNETWTIIEVE